MPKLTLDDITSGYASITQLNNNFAAIEAAIENTVSRDGTTPNSMSGDLDMDGNAILNVGDMTIDGFSLADLAADAEAAAASAAAALISETNAAASEDAAAEVAGQLVDLEYKGAWTDATLYKVNNIVYYSTDGGSYICTVEHTSSGTLDAAKFGKLADKGAAGAGTGDMLKSENLSGLANYATARSNMGLIIGTHVQAYDAELAAIAGLTSAANKLPYFTGSATAAVTDLSAFGRTLIDDADAATARTTLGVGTATSEAAGIVELATTGEAAAGTLTNVVVTPAGVLEAKKLSYNTATTSTNGATTKTITGIPSWARKITVSYWGLSNSVVSGGSIYLELGDAGGIETGNVVDSVPDASITASSTIVLANVSGNTWVGMSPEGNFVQTLTQTLSQLRVRITNAAFDAGTLTVYWE